MVRVELYRTPSSRACDETRAMLGRLQAELPFELVEVDVTRDPEARRRFERDVPVLFVDGRRVLSGEIAEGDARRRIERAAESAEGAREGEGNPIRPRAMRRVKVAFAIVALAALAGMVAWKAWEVVAFRPRTVRLEPREEFGIEPASTPAPPIDLQSMDGTRFSLARARGQVVFVNFWATFCAPCRQEMPSMIRLGRDLAERFPGRFQMLAVSADVGWEPVREFFAGPPFAGAPGGLTVALDAEQTVTRAYYCAARGFCPDLLFPETYIVDKTGRLVAYIVGPRDWSHPAARAFLERLLGS